MRGKNDRNKVQKKTQPWKEGSETRYNYLNTGETLVGEGRDNDTQVGGNYLQEKLLLFTWRKQKALKQPLKESWLNSISYQ